MENALYQGGAGGYCAPPQMLTLAQIQPGLPRAGFAASVSLLPFCSEPVRAFLVDRSPLLRAPNEGASAVTRIWAETEEQHKEMVEAMTTAQDEAARLQQELNIYTGWEENSRLEPIEKLFDAAYNNEAAELGIHRP